jgi:hypothetical protein
MVHGKSPARNVGPKYQNGWPRLNAGVKNRLNVSSIRP